MTTVSTALIAAEAALAFVSKSRHTIYYRGGQHDHENDHQNHQRKKILIPTGSFASDWFKCSNCGFEERKLIPSWQNTSTCTQCGGTAYRQ